MTTVVVIGNCAETIRPVHAELERVGCSVLGAGSVSEGLACVAGRAPDCVVLDARLADGGGLDALDRIRAVDPALPVIVLADVEAPDLAAAALRRGATDAFPKHGRYAKRLAWAIRDAVARRALGRVDARITCSPFIGRSAELAAVRFALGEAERGRGRVIALTGEAGIGKTRLAQEAAEQASECGFAVCWGHAHDTAGAPPYWPWLQVMRACRTTDGGIDNRARDAMAAVPPPGGDPPGDLLATEEQRFRFFDHVSALLKQAARGRPLLILLEDLHWADAPTLLLLQFVGREITHARVLIIASYRSDEVALAAPLAEALARVRGEPAFERLVLRGLSCEDVRAQIAAMVGRQPPRPFARAVFQRSDGNPFCVQEIIRCLVEEGRVDFHGARWTRELKPEDMPIPDSISAAIQRRLARLSDDARAVLASASAIGREFTVDALLPPVALPPTRVVAALDELIAGRVLVRMSGRVATYRFVHVLVRETLCAGLPAEVRARVHQPVESAATARHDCAGGAVPGTERSSFRRAGDFWIVTHRGTTIHLKHSRAVSYLALLLRHPMIELHALDLVAMANGNGAATIVQNGLGPALDARGRVDLRAAREDLRAQLEEAEQWNDEGRLRDLRAKLQALEEYVLANYGLCGRARDGKASAEQARQAVTKGVAATRRRITEHLPALGRHFETYVNTGYVCSYTPPPEDPITWVVDCDPLPTP